MEQVIETYDISEPECIGFLAELDRLGVIELKPLNRYSLRVSNAFHWLADGPVQQYVREHVVADYFGGRFDGPGETLMCLPARLSLPSARELLQKIQQLAAELARLHQNDRRLATERTRRLHACCSAFARGSLPRSPRCGARVDSFYVRLSR